VIHSRPDLPYGAIRPVTLPRIALTLMLALPGMVLVPSPVSAQEAAVIEILAPVLAAEDARAWRPADLRKALVYPDSFVRQTAARSVGRIGDPRGVPLLVPLLVDPDTTVRVAAVFALGILRDTAAIAPLAERLRTPPALDAASASEAMTALAQIGGPGAAEVLSAVLQRRGSFAIEDPEALIPVAALEAWRLGADAPVNELLSLVRSDDENIRWRAVFSLSRLMAPEAVGRLGEALSDQQPLVRSFAVRAFTRAYADSSELGAEGAAALVARLLDDREASVRIGALRAIGALGAQRFTSQVIPRIDDAGFNVRVQAVATLGQLGGAEAVTVLERVARNGNLFAMQREALLGLARTDTAAFRRVSPDWQKSPRWEERAVIAEGSGALGGRPPLIDDPDPRVVAAALVSWGRAGGGEAFMADARRLALHEDLAVRATAVGFLSESASPGDIPLFRQAYELSARDESPDAAIAALEALAGLARRSQAVAAQVNAQFLGRVGSPSSYVIRQWAQDRWPAAAARWGAPFPAETGRTLQDYRELVRRYLTGPDSLRRPHVIIEVEQRGSIELELLGPEAPMTVANFLALVDRGAFNGIRWHRVVPNFVIQTGDPRGDGWGAATGPIRDEINRVRFLTGIAGMAHSGPETGSSQWFITLSPQPHLDGAYTVFGRVVGTMAPLPRITQGDVIRIVRR